MNNFECKNCESIVIWNNSIINKCECGTEHNGFGEALR